jgi:para-nitrobenzyl esterase
MKGTAFARRFGLTTVTLAVVAALGGGPSPAAAAAPPTVTLGGVTVTGIDWPSTPGVSAFLGLEYAASPQGNLRWFPPQPLPLDRLNPDATHFGSACPQAVAADGTLPQIQTALVTGPGPTFQFVEQAEECLFLNVFVPATAPPSSKLPVFFWIHGGALVSGTGAQYDPSQMALSNNIIVVTINYRLGALGWLAQASLEPSQNGVVSAGSFMDPDDAGNYGLMDQQLAMAWVRANIAAFGGDPTKVTIGGESAGGLSTFANLASTNTAPGLFRGAIIQSGAYMLHDLPSESSYEAKFGDAFVGALSCTSSSGAPTEFGCLQASDLSDILTAQGAVFGSFGISPDSGTKMLPRGLRQAFSAGAFIHVPVLHGTNANEGRLFEPALIPFAASPATVIAAGGPANYDLTNANAFCGGGPCTYPREIELFVGELGLPTTPAFVNLLSREYPLRNFPDRYLPNNAPSSDEALAQIFTDLVFACNAFDADVELNKFVPVYAYEFNDPNAPPFGAPVQAPNDVFGFPTASQHGAELQFLFNLGTPLTPEELTLASEMQGYWANFVKTLTPNGSSLMPWLPFGSFGSVQELVPSPDVPGPSFLFPFQHFCPTWQPILNAESLLTRLGSTRHLLVREQGQARGISDHG